MFTSYLLCWVRRNHFLLLLLKSPNGAILLHSPGRKPWVNRLPHLLSPIGAAQPQRKANTRAVSAAPKGAHFIFICRSPGFHFGLCPHSTLGYAGVSPLQGLFGLLKRCRAYDTHNAPEPWCACPALGRSLISCIALQWSHTNWRIVLKISYFAPKHRHNVLKIKEDSLLDWLLDIWGQKQKKN